MEKMGKKNGKKRLMMALQNLKKRRSKGAGKETMQDRLKRLQMMKKK